MYELNMHNINDVGAINYRDDDIAIIDNFNSFPQNHPVKLGVMLIIICTKGTLRIDINIQTMTVHSYDLLFCCMNRVVDGVVFSADFKGKALVLSDSGMHKLLYMNKDIWNKFFYISKYPLLHLQGNDIALLGHYYRLTRIKMDQSEDPYHKNIMHILLKAMLYELFMTLNRSVEPLDDHSFRRGEALFKNFIELLSQMYYTERTVTYYSDKLSVTATHLSTVCKKLSGKSTMDWIASYTIEEIRYLLKYTDSSITEISDKLHFSDLSFFGKYVKKHLGVSPYHYRKQVPF